jgi:hypothetical protein
MAISCRVAPRPAPRSSRPPEEDVEHRGALGDADRVAVAEGQAHDAVAEADAAGPGGDVGQEDVGGGHVGVAEQRVVLDGPDPVEAGGLGGHGLRHAVGQGRPLALGRRVRQLGLEDHGELHR